MDVVEAGSRFAVSDPFDVDSLYFREMGIVGDNGCRFHLQGGGSSDRVCCGQTSVTDPQTGRREGNGSRSTIRKVDLTIESILKLATSAPAVSCSNLYTL